MRIRLAVSILVLVCSGFGSAMAQTWRIGDDQPFPIHISDLPAARQKAILMAIDPSLQKRAKDYGYEPADVAAIRKSLLLRDLATPSGTLLLIQGWGSESCGAVGNCAVWVLGKNDRLLLEGGGNRIRILAATHHGLPTILISDHMSAAQSGLTWYVFDSSKYRRVSCAIETYSDINRTYSLPLIERGPCEK
jgi:hypothetical protein